MYRARERIGVFSNLIVTETEPVRVKSYSRGGVSALSRLLSTTSVLPVSPLSRVCDSADFVFCLSRPGRLFLFCRVPLIRLRRGAARGSRREEAVVALPGYPLLRLPGAPLANQRELLHLRRDLLLRLDNLRLEGSSCLKLSSLIHPPT